MSTATEGAEIRYTTDGTEPTAESELYSAPIAITANCRFLARAYAEGMFESAVTEYTVDDLTVPVPVAEFTNKALVLSVEDELAEILYTMDGEASVESGEAWTLYTEPIALTSDCTVRFFARREGFHASEVGEFEFVYADYQVSAPVIERSEGFITMSTATEGAEIRYTTDGTEPTAESELYSAPIAITANCRFLARAYAEGMFESAVTEYTVDDLTVPVPVAEFTNKALVLSVEDELAEILYTMDGEASVESAEAWTLYTEPIALTSDCTVRFFARRDGFNDSEVGEFEFVYADYQVSAPEIEYDKENNLVIITCETEGAEIRYTTDGTEPTAESELYTGAIEVDHRMTVRARAFATDMFDSEVTEKEIDYTSTLQVVNMDGASIRIACDGTDLVIYSDKSLTLPLYDLRGVLVRNIDLENGRNVVSGLSRGTYIIAGKKIML